LPAVGGGCTGAADLYPHGYALLNRHGMQADAGTPPLHSVSLPCSAGEGQGGGILKREVTAVCRSLWLTCSLLPLTASADLNHILACRQLPPGPVRSDCLERTTAALEREQHTAATTPAAKADAPASITAQVTRLTYEQGRPVFLLDNGETWVSQDRRRL